LEIDFSILYQNDCTICINKINFEHKHHLRCGHVFHYDCIKLWLEINDICPNCKQTVEVEEEYQDEEEELEDYFTEEEGELFSDLEGISEESDIIIGDPLIYRPDPNLRELLLRQI
jgi:hypothetical protein